MRIPISFTEEEQELYAWVKKKKGKSAFIKELLEEAKKEEEKKNSPAKSSRIIRL